MTLVKAKLASSITFIVLASFMIVTYDRQNMFIIQATDGSWDPDIFCNFYFLRNHKIADNSATTKATEKISADLESIEF